MTGARTVTVGAHRGILMVTRFVIPGMTTGARGFIGCLVRIIDEGLGVGRMTLDAGDYRAVVARIIRTAMGKPYTGSERYR